MFLDRFVEFEIAQGFFDDPCHVGGGGTFGQIEVRAVSYAFEGFFKMVDVEQEDDLGARALSGNEGDEIGIVVFGEVKIEYEDLVVAPSDFAEDAFCVVASLDLHVR